jgi:hypothetical protein
MRNHGSKVDVEAFGPFRRLHLDLRTINAQPLRPLSDPFTLDPSPLLLDPRFRYPHCRAANCLGRRSLNTIHDALIHFLRYPIYTQVCVKLRAAVHTNMSTFTIPRKEIAEPSPAHLKEVDTARSTNSEWDIPEEGQSKKKHNYLGAGAGATGWALSDRFNRMLPPHRRYFGRSRRTLLIVILVAFLCLLALIIGLAVGLKSSKKYDLPHSHSHTHANEWLQDSEPSTP